MEHFFLYLFSLLSVIQNLSCQSRTIKLELYNITNEAILKMEISDTIINIKQKTTCLEKEELIKIMKIKDQDFEIKRADTYSSQKNTNCYELHIKEKHVEGNILKIFAIAPDNNGYLGFLLKQERNYYKLYKIDAEKDFAKVKANLNDDDIDIYLPYISISQLEDIQDWKQMSDLNDNDCENIKSWNSKNAANFMTAYRKLPHPFNPLFDGWRFENIIVSCLLENKIDPFEISKSYKEINKLCDGLSYDK